MIDDCVEGKIDLIITKSVSRFSRNVVDCLSVVRQLGNLTPRVGVFFQTENINTFKKDNETFLTILAAFSQEESRAKSESMLWSYERRYNNQNFMTPTESLLVIRGCSAVERDCFEVAENLFEKPSVAYELTSRLFMRAILNQTGWDENYSYRLNGRYSEELGVVSFDMNHPERITVK